MTHILQDIHNISSTYHYTDYVFYNDYTLIIYRLHTNHITHMDHNHHMEFNDLQMDFIHQLHTIYIQIKTPLHTDYTLITY
jgi:hypothetical protein